MVLAGGKGWLYDEIFDKVRQLGLESEVIFPGFVADDEQVLWYRAASAFAYPSLYEGFGIPVTEALVCGMPTVTSTVSSLPEAGAGIALCVDRSHVVPHEALQKALTDTTYRLFAPHRPQLVAQKFSAHAMATQTIAVYEQAALLHTSHRQTHVPTFVR